MVHQKNGDTEFDFLTQGIESYVDDGWVKARGTTLGADNGIGAASIMAVLASDSIEHGPIEGLFTIDEETGMTGAFKLQPGILQGKILLNTDTEDEGELTIGCAGGVDSSATMSYDAEPVSDGEAIEIAVRGLRGGHSGCEIHIGRGNANKLMNRILWTIQQAEGIDLRIALMNGGNLRNAIPRESTATVVIGAGQGGQFENSLKPVVAAITDELKRTEPDLLVTASPAEMPLSLLPIDVQQNILAAIYAAPCGVIRNSDEMPGLVETSTSLSRVNVADGKASVDFLTRSSVESAKDDVSNRIDAAFALAGFETHHSGGYPGWAPNADSEILELMKTVYADLFDTPATVNAVHAGLECGIIGSHYPGLDMISFGPTIRNPHSPDEKCEIATVEKYWRFLHEVLKRVPAA